MDVAVAIPKECFKAKDRLNNVYFEKRAVYLLELANQILKHKNIFSEAEFQTFRGDRLKPILVLKIAQQPQQTTTTNFVLRIFPIADKDSFPLEKFVPTNNNNRNTTLGENETQPSTPLYNNRVNEDIYLREHVSHLFSIFNEHPNFVETSKLLKVWLRQRELEESSDRYYYRK